MSKTWVKPYRNNAKDISFMLNYGNSVILIVNLLVIASQMSFEPDYMSILSKMAYFAMGSSTGLAALGIIQDKRFRRHRKVLDKMVIRSEREHIKMLKEIERHQQLEQNSERNLQ